MPKESVASLQERIAALDAEKLALMQGIEEEAELLLDNTKISVPASHFIRFRMDLGVAEFMCIQCGKAIGVAFSWNNLTHSRGCPSAAHFGIAHSDNPEAHA